MDRAVPAADAGNVRAFLFRFWASARRGRVARAVVRWAYAWAPHVLGRLHLPGRHPSTSSQAAGDGGSPSIISAVRAPA